MLVSLTRVALFFALTAFIASPIRADSLQRADGSFITYHLLNRATEGRQGLILMLQGSGCEPVIAREWLRTEPPVLASDRAVLAVEKYGVSDGNTATDKFEDGCSIAYWRGNTLHQRVFDATQVLAHLRKEDWWNGELIIYGGSEGGAIAAMLAPLIPETQSIIIISSGIGVSVSDLILSAVPPSVAAQLPEILKEAEANPSPMKRFGGASYRWWADAADIIPARLLLQADVPILFIHGTRDQFAPLFAARATQKMFVEAGKTNLVYREFKGYDHHMVDEAGIDRREEVLKLMATWLDENLQVD